MSNQYASAGHLKRGENIFGKNTDRVSLCWNEPLNENHSLAKVKSHYKMANKATAGKMDIVWEQKVSMDDKKK